MSKIFVKDYLLTQNNFIEKCKNLINEKFKNTPTFFVHSYGCQGNVSEGEKIEGILKEIGFLKVNNLDAANLIILNSCAIREKAENKLFSHLGNVLNLKNSSGEKIVGVCGCMVQQNHILKKIKKSFPSVNLVFGTHVIDKLPEFLFNILTNSKMQCFNISSEENIVENIPILRTSKIKALVPISYGCNNFCSYCIVPYVKGIERSRDFKIIVNEVKGLVEKGYKEITLLGQNVNSYGKDLNLNNAFLKLLQEINLIKGEFKLRFMTSHPKDFSKELIEGISKCNKVCKHFHLPVQSGCDEILKNMNRKYTKKQYLEIIDYIKFLMPKATFSTDIIVGFPGETYENFKETLELVKKVKFSAIYNFIYSKRAGTKAAEMEDLITKEEKTKWLEELIKTQNEISYENNKKYVGKIENVFFEDVLNDDENFMVGKTEGNIMVTCKKDEKKIGNFCDVEITKAHRTKLEGKLI